MGSVFRSLQYLDEFGFICLPFSYSVVYYLCTMFLGLSLGTELLITCMMVEVI